MRNDPFHRAVPDHAAYEKKAQEVRKTSLEAATAEFFGELIEQLQENNPEQLQALLDFYAGKVTRWSSRNLLAIRVQKPQIQRAVTPTEIKAHGHTLKPGAKAASIWVPVFEGAQELREHQRTLARQVQWSQQAGIDLHDVPAVRSEYADWKERQVAVIREDRALAEAGGTAAAIDEDDERLIAQATSVEAYLQSERPDWVLDETKADAIGHILQSALEQAGAFNPAPPQGGDRVGWALSACVYDLGKDTEGPALDLPGAAIDPQEGRQFLEAAGLYAKFKGVEVTTEAGGMGGGEAGAVGLYRKKGGRQEEKIYLARWSGLATRCATVLHEIAHYLAGHHRVERAKDQTARREQSRPEEHLAEATAYVVGRQFGIPVDYSAAYLKSWGATPFELQRQLSAVRDLSKEMILGIEDELQTLQRKQKAGEAARLDPRQEPDPRTATEPVLPGNVRAVPRQNLR